MSTQTRRRGFPCTLSALAGSAENQERREAASKVGKLLLGFPAYF